MRKQKNPATTGDRVVWNALTSASAQHLTPSAPRAQQLIGSNHNRAEALAAANDCAAPVNQTDGGVRHER